MKLSTNYGNKLIEFEVEYRDRKTLAIQIEPMDKIFVISPNGLPEEVIRDKVKSKGKWILKKLLYFKDIGYLPYNREFVNGETFMYLGRNYSLEIVKYSNIKRPKVYISDGKFYLETPTKEQTIMRKAMKRWYRKEAEKIIEKRVEFYIPKVNLIPNKIKIKEQKKRWGSCSYKGNIYFNWRAIMAPSNIIDYIVVHELCHLDYRDHSKKFWQKVESILPDFKDGRKWLKKYGVRMDL